MDKYNLETQLGTLVQLIEKGKLVALVGENTYLVCSAINESAIADAFRRKGTRDNPLIIYSANLTMANRFIENISHEAFVAANNLYPCSTLFILPVKKTIPGIVTCNLDAAAFACPVDKTLRQISCLLDAPIVLIKVDPAVLEHESDEIAAVEYNLYFPKEPIVFDGRDGLRRVESSNVSLIS